MQALLRLSRFIDGTTRFIGHHVRWLVLAAVLISAINAVMRKFFDLSSNAWLELQWLLFGAVFMLAASFTLQRNAHIRIDVLSSRWSKRTRDWVDLFGHLFMLAPLTLVMTWLAAPAFLESFRSGERSVNSGGLAVWPAKFLVFAGFLLLFFQMISEVIKRIAVLRGAIADPEPEPVHGHNPEDVTTGGAHAE